MAYEPPESSLHIGILCHSLEGSKNCPPAFPKSTSEPELDIVDNRQGEVARDTCSESFLVSLAFALSDLDSHKTSINSLLLDDGLGPLDADTMEIALNALAP